MEAKAMLRYVRVAPRKARMAIDLIRGKNAEEAMTILKFTPRAAARVVEKILKSAVANATQKDMGDVDALRVSRVFVDVGPTMKRVLPRAMGRANTIRKRTSHITVVIEAEAEEAKSVHRSSAVKEKQLPQETVKAKAKDKPQRKSKAEIKKKEANIKEPTSKKGGGE